MRRLALLLVASACSGASSPTASEAPIRVVVTADPELRVDWQKLEVDPTGVRRFVASDDRLVIELDPARAPTKLTLLTPESCPESVDLANARSGSIIESRLRPFLRVTGGDLTQVGFDAPFRVTLTPSCREALRGRITWRQTLGPSVEVHPEQNGFVLAGKTLPLTGTRREPIPWGIVPFSQRTRGQYGFEAEWQGDRKLSLSVMLSASARTTGLPSVTVGEVLHLGGTGWRVRERPRDSHAEVDAARGRFRPDARGRWLLEDGAHRELALTAGRHSETPLDCGRSECHARATAAAKDSPMTTIFARGLAGELLDYDPSCALACHTAGEPGLDDGGFVAMLASLGRGKHLATGPTAWDSLPSPLRRLGGVGCTSCHGPGAIPEASASWAILRSDVCATCHDAPPRYAHVIAWQKTRMARSDLDPTTRAEPCARCHTTSGFLHARGIRPEKSRPDSDVTLGISCSACHAPHGDHVAGTLIRDIPLAANHPKLPESARESRVCVTCHAPDTTNARGPSQATLVFGGDDPPHAKVPGGCVGCHLRGESSTSTGPRGQGHDFTAKPAACAGCHAAGRTETLKAGVQPVRERARKLWEEFGDPPKKLSPLASPALPPPAHARKPARPDSEGLAKLLLVLEDPAAGAHNAAYARALLDEAERLLRK